jgi:hypothetical protein
MARKARRSGKITGHGTDGYYAKDGPCVVLHGEITDDADAGRPVALKMTPAEARKWAAGLIRMADYVEGFGPSPEPEPEAPKGRLAELLGMTEREDSD